MLDTLVMVKLHVVILMNVLLAITIVPLLEESAKTETKNAWLCLQPSLEEKLFPSQD